MVVELPRRSGPVQRGLFFRQHGCVGGAGTVLRNRAYLSRLQRRYRLHQQAGPYIRQPDKELGGILNQCIHNGFGLHTFQEELTGPEYAGRFIEQVEELQIEYRLHTMVMDISRDKVVTAMNSTDGLFEIKAGSVILAMGCRERSRGALNIPGYRPAGIFPRDGPEACQYGRLSAGA